jgi:hypothetical protein
VEARKETRACEGSTSPTFSVAPGRISTQGSPLGCFFSSLHKSWMPRRISDRMSIRGRAHLLSNTTQCLYKHYSGGWAERPHCICQILYLPISCCIRFSTRLHQMNGCAASRLFPTLRIREQRLLFERIETKTSANSLHQCGQSVVSGSFYRDQVRKPALAGGIGHLGN